MIVAGNNYGQGSSREHAALAPRYLGLRIVIAKDFARIHWQNLCNFGVLPLRFEHPEQYDRLAEGEVIALSNMRLAIQQGNRMEATIKEKNKSIRLIHDLSPRQIEFVLVGGYINWLKKKPVFS